MILTKMPFTGWFCYRLIPCQLFSMQLVATTNYWTWPLGLALTLSYGLIFPFMALYPYVAFSAGFMDTSYIGLVRCTVPCVGHMRAGPHVVLVRCMVPCFGHMLQKMLEQIGPASRVDNLTLNR